MVETLVDFCNEYPQRQVGEMQGLFVLGRKNVMLNGVRQPKMPNDILAFIAEFMGPRPTRILQNLIDQKSVQSQTTKASA